MRCLRCGTAAPRPASEYCSGSGQLPDEHYMVADGIYLQHEALREWRRAKEEYARAEAACLKAHEKLKQAEAQLMERAR